ncbi:MAG: CDP-glycerol glycerophosphotransferase family protein [Lachnospiraceae bacterium]|nr:CDP-glycerol glycerophosphotransferase family protein [Lachnospiraceae bacterium]
MFKSVAIKKALKSTVFTVATFINKVIPKEDSIVILYSANRGVNNNLKGVKDYLLQEDFDKKYRIVCGVPNLSYAEDDTDRVEYLPRLKTFLLFLRAGHVFYTTGQIPIKPSKNQTVVHLDHGTANFKCCGALSKIKNGDEFFFTYYLAPSKAYIPIVEKTFLCPKENIQVCGEAVTDAFYKEYQKYDLGNYKKIILWAPTFRQSDFYGYNDSEEELLPMYSEEEYEELNQILKKFDFCLIVKLHAGQKLEKYEQRFYSNLKIYSDKEFNDSGMELYQLMMQVDYLLADYSSVFLQFLLLDKPMAFVVPDFEEYAEKRGFVFDKPYDYMPGPIIKNKNALYECLENWFKGIDGYEQERKRVCDVIHEYQDGNNAKRAVEIANMYL